jgi:tetratricopeptide (TPR) repeat protein
MIYAMKVIALIIRKPFVFGVLVFLFYGTLLCAEQKIENDYKRRILGDQAFNDGLYDVAKNYYKHYLKNAGGNTAASRDAYYCLIATCLKATNIEEAEKFYKKVAVDNKNYFKLNPLEEEKLKYWNAEIMLTKGLTEEAQDEFSRIASKTEKKNKDLYAKSLIGEGICDIRLMNWNSAEQIFQTVYNVSEDPADKTKALEQLILVKLVSGKFESASQLIKKEIKDSKKSSNSLQLLKIYSMVKKEKLKEAEAEYIKLNSDLTAEDSVLSFLVLSAFAEEYIKNNGYDKAIDKLQQAFSKAPGLYEKEITAVLTLNTLIDAKKYKAAAKSSKIFLDFFPDSILRDKILLTYIDILIKLDTDPAKILPVINKYYSFKSNPVKIQVDISIRIGKVLYQIGDYKNALRYFLYSFKNGLCRSQCGEALFWEGKTYAKLGEIDNALEQLNKIDSKIPEWQEKAMHEIALIYLEQKNYVNAKVKLNEFIEKFSNSKLNPPGLFLYAAALSGNNEINEAVYEYLDFAEKFNKNSFAPEAFCRAGDLSLRLADFKGAVKCYQKVLDFYPKSKIIPEVLYKLLYSYYLSGGYEKAVEVVEDLNKKYPDSDYSQQASFWLVDYYTANKKYDKAMEQLTIITQKYRNDQNLLDKAMYEKSDLFFKMGKYKSAIKCLDDYISKNKDHKKLGRAYYLQGDIYSEDGKFDDAIESYKQVLMLNDDSELKTAAQGRIADCYFAVINFADNRNEAVKLAVSAYKELLNHDKISKFIMIQTNYKLGKCYEILGDKESAIMSYHKALYENILGLEDSAEADKEWMAKAGIALSRILLEENTQKSAEMAIKIYKTLITNGVQPKSDFEKRINEIMKKYKIKENI